MDQLSVWKIKEVNDCFIYGYLSKFGNTWRTKQLAQFNEYCENQSLILKTSSKDWQRDFVSKFQVPNAIDVQAGSL